MQLTSNQEQYLSALLEKTEEELLLEICKGALYADSIKGLQLSPRRSSESGKAMRAAPSRPIEPTKQEQEEYQQVLRNTVPDEPIGEEQKDLYLNLLPRAEARVDVMRQELYVKLCESSTCKPQEWTIDIVTGQQKDVIAAVVTILTVNYATEMALAIPLAVLLIKNGLNSFCAVPPIIDERLIAEVMPPLPPEIPLRNSSTSSVYSRVIWIVAGLLVIGLVLTGIFF